MRGRQRWLQFGIGTLLFVMLCVAGFFAGYRRGFDSGNEEKERARMAQARSTPYAKAYYIGDILSASTDSGTMEQILPSYIQAAVIPQSWNGAGGPGALSFYANNKSLVVSNIQDVHDQLADTLEQIRRMQQQGKAQEIESALASAGNSQTSAEH
jgi:hypothetical protein